MFRYRTFRTRTFRSLTIWSRTFRPLPFWTRTFRTLTFWTWTFRPRTFWTRTFRPRTLLDVSLPGRSAPGSFGPIVSFLDLLDLDVSLPDIPEQVMSDQDVSPQTFWTWTFHPLPFFWTRMLRPLTFWTWTFRP